MLGGGTNGAAADAEPDWAVAAPAEFSPVVVGMNNDCAGIVMQMASLSTTPMCQRSQAT